MMCGLESGGISRVILPVSGTRTGTTTAWRKYQEGVKRITGHGG